MRQAIKRRDIRGEDAGAELAQTLDDACVAAGGRCEHEIRVQGKDRLDVLLPEARQALDLGRVIGRGGDGRHEVTAAEGERQLGDVRGERHDS